VQAQKEGKSRKLQQDGRRRLRKSLAEITLLGQPYVKDPDQTVENCCSRGRQRARIRALRVGAGIEKKQEDFVAE